MFQTTHQVPMSFLCWLVVDLPFWKIIYSQMGWWNSQYMKKKNHVPNISKPPTSMVLTGVSIWVYMEFLVLIIYWGTQLNLIPNTYIYIHMHMRHAQNMAYDGIWVYGHPSHNGNPYNEYFNPINGLTSIAQYGKLTHVLTTTCVWSFWRKHNMDFKTSLKWENRWSFTIPADQLQYWL